MRTLDEIMRLLRYLKSEQVPCACSNKIWLHVKKRKTIVDNDLVVSSFNIFGVCSGCQKQVSLVTLSEDEIEHSLDIALHFMTGQPIREKNIPYNEETGV